MKKTLNSFDTLLGRIDAVLVDAAEEYPNIFDFASDSLAEAEDRVEWAEQMVGKGYLPKSTLEAFREKYEKLKRRAQPKTDATPNEPAKARPGENRKDPFAKPEAPRVDAPKTSPF